MPAAACEADCSERMPLRIAWLDSIPRIYEHSPWIESQTWKLHDSYNTFRHSPCCKNDLHPQKAYSQWRFFIMAWSKSLSIWHLVANDGILLCELPCLEAEVIIRSLVLWYKCCGDVLSHFTEKTLPLLSYEIAFRCPSSLQLSVRPLSHWSKWFRHGDSGCKQGLWLDSQKLSSAWPPHSWRKLLDRLQCEASQSQHRCLIA